MTNLKEKQHGFGLQALKLLQEFYEGKFISSKSDAYNMSPMVVEDDSEMSNLLEETIAPRKSLPPLLFELEQVRPEILDYIGVSYGLSEDLLRFWKRAQFLPVYLAHAPNQLTGEHSCIMLKQLKGLTTSSDWLIPFWIDFCEKLLHCLPLPKFSSNLALDLVMSDCFKAYNSSNISKFEVLCYSDDLNILKKVYQKKMPLNYIISVFAQFYFSHRLPNVHLNREETVVLFNVGICDTPLEKISEVLNVELKEIKETFFSSFVKIADSVLEL